MGPGWGDARRAAYDAAPALAPVLRAPGAARGLRLAAPLVARDDLPRFDNAAMDGYAVAGPGPWRLRGSTLAGEAAPATPLTAGEAWRVATGAPLPPGTRAVLQVERAEVAADRVAEVSGTAGVGGPLDEGRHVRRRGEEAVPGEKLLPAGVEVTPQVVALAAAVGTEELAVTPPARVVGLVTGDELAPADPVDTGGRVRDAIGPALPGWVTWAGGELTTARRVPDGAGPLREALTAGLAEAEVVVVSGSSSVGPADHLREVVAVLGAVPVLDTLSCRPGRLAGLWRLPDGRLVAGLPGNPFAALVAFLAVAAPALAGLRGDPLPLLAPLPTGELTRPATGCRLVPVRLGADGPVPVGHDRSGMLRGVAAADALAVVPAGDGPVLRQPLPR